MTTPRPDIAQTRAPSGKQTTRIWTPANILTLFRIALTLPFLYLVKQGRFGSALIVFFVASLTDYFDGFVARRFNQQSPLGRFLDPLADKLLTTATYIVMAIPHEGFPSIPLWVAVAVVGRDVVILAGSAVVYLVTRYKGFRPTILGKVNTFVELGLIVWFLVFHTTGEFTYLLPGMYAVVIISIIGSGSEYLIQGGLILAQAKNPAPEAN
ncbi:MAG TPA: CDP-alcohol phosphatidyltransferase family protein [Blastocatellia bacterium]|nr:CDP-alcohol phosphatidyltransferase family protein [Blastocatellia bacterium]